MADIPGLIEGAHEGKGLGVEFLRHVERTLVLVHMIDVYSDNVANTYKTIKNELASYKIDLTKRPEIVVLNKIDGYDKELLKLKIEELRAVVPKRTKIQAISAASKENIKDFIDDLFGIVVKERAKQLKKAAKKAGDQTLIIRLNDTHDKWKVTKNSSGYLVSGTKIEKFASRTEFSNVQSQQRLLDIMRKMGIMHELTRLKAQPGTKVQIGSHGSVEI